MYWRGLMSSKSKEWLLYNAVLSWLSHYGGMGSDLTPQYQELAKELENEQSTTTKTQKRGRPAKRQRTKKATSNPSSTEESKATNQET